jgi:hypothetical protein
MKNFGFNKYFKPTPTNLRRLGDSLLVAATFATTSSIILEKPGLAIIIIILGTLGKFITNFFSDDDDE